MKLVLFRHLWGVEEPWEQAFPKFRAFGYEGVEGGMPAQGDAEHFRDLLGEHGLAYIPQIFTGGKSQREHLDSFREQVAAAKHYCPYMINAHSGLDAFTQEEGERFFEGALEIEAGEGVRIAHETHRGRILYNPWTTERLLSRFDKLQLCCDFSHWVCVCERLLEDQIEIIRECARHCVHVHARVGYEQGPQVPDPRAPEYSLHLEAHEAWWRLIWKEQDARRDSVSTLTPEFGPPHYQHTLPFSETPVSDFREISDWQATHQREAFWNLFSNKH